MTFRNRVSRCVHGIAIGLPEIHCEVSGCVASRQHGERRLCRQCRGQRAIGEFSVNGDGSLRSSCKRCEAYRQRRRGEAVSNPKPNPRPARAPAFVCFRELQGLADQYERRGRYWLALGNEEAGGQCLEFVGALRFTLKALEGR